MSSLKRIRGLLLVLLLILPYILLSGIVGAITVLNQLPGFPKPELVGMIQGVIGVGLLLILLSLYWKLYKKQVLRVTNVSPILQNPLCPLALYVVMLALELVLPLEDNANQAVVNQLVTTYPVIGFSLVVILAPIFEELLFRGFLATYVFEQLRGNRAIISYCLISALLFSLPHGPRNIYQFLLYFTMGFSLAWLYLCKKDIRYNILLHAFNNLLGFVFILFF